MVQDLIIKEYANQAWAFQVKGTAYTEADFEFFSNSSVWENQPINVGGFQVIPYGQTNNLPKELRKVMDENNLGEGIFKRQRGLIYGQGPALYTIETVDGLRTKKWMDDPEITAWLESWYYDEYLRNCIVDYNHMEGCFSKVFLNRMGRIGGPPKIVKLEHIGIHKCRLEYPTDKKTVKRVIVGDWDIIPNELTVYNVFDPKEPFSFPVSIQYSNMYSFARDFYSYPAYYGALNWIRRSSAIPQTLKALSDNSLNVKWHVISPASYWQAKEEMLKTQCSLKQTAYTPQLLEDLKDDTYAALAKVMSGVDNVGKFFASEKSIDGYGNMEGWEIIPIDMKVKDFIDAQIAIANKADSATTSGLGLHPSLSNIMVDGKLASGSEQLYALKLYLSTEVDIPETIICRTINEAIKANFPGRNVRLGFYHDVVKTEENVNPENRMKNVV